MALKPIIFILLGPDRPGLVEKISALVVRYQGNWLESHLSKMGGYFGGMALVEVQEEESESLVKALQGLEGLTLFIQEGGSDSFDPEELTVARLELVGLDQPGIVSRISTAIARLNVNVLELITERSSAPMAGNEIFRARAQLELPGDVGVDQLRESLESLTSDLMVDLTLQPSKT